jgi:hypothetical protein
MLRTVRVLDSGWIYRWSGEAIPPTVEEWVLALQDKASEMR